MVIVIMVMVLDFSTKTHNTSYKDRHVHATMRLQQQKILYWESRTEDKSDLQQCFDEEDQHAQRRSS